MDRIQRDRLIERYKTAFAGHGKREQVRIGDLSRAMEPLRVDGATVKQADLTLPEFVMSVLAARASRSSAWAGCTGLG